MFDITKKSSLDAAFDVAQLNRNTLLDPDARKANEHMQWIAAQGAAARILGALADGETPTAASQSAGVTMTASPFANMCEFVTLTNAGLDPEVGRARVGELRKDDAASAVELWAGNNTASAAWPAFFVKDESWTTCGSRSSPPTTRKRRAPNCMR